MSTAPSKPVRVRIAPSPTGDPHIGTAYIALFNYVFAKHHGGKFIVRIEDTDQTRYRRDSESMIMDSLRWVGLTPDEGPGIGGPFAPYRQSERTALYQKSAHELLERGHAYRCFCSSERLDAVRKANQAEKGFAGYDRTCRNLSSEQVDRALSQNAAHVIRMKMPLEGKTSFNDGLRGSVAFDNETIDDQVLLKSDGFPTYHLACVVDDHFMEISHVIRGEDWITSTPKHVVLFDAFGWERPEYIHLPLLRNNDKSKISKRKNPTSINYYRRKGILPDALRNFLSLMGWNFGDNREIFSTEEMITGFTWDRFTLGGPVFDMQKLTWLNGQYMKVQDDTAYLKHLREEIFSERYLAQIIPLVKERVEKFEDFVSQTAFFFSGDLPYDSVPLVPKGRTASDLALNFSEILDRLELFDVWELAEIQAMFEAYLAEKGLKAKDIYMPVRLALTGTKESPPLFDTLFVLGKEIVRRRIRLAIVHLQTLSEKEA